MNPNYITHALCFHGQPLQKIWEDERGVEDLRKMRIQQPSYAIYQERQKYFTFQERAKRLKLHQFLARKAEDLYDRSLVGNVMEEKLLAEGRKHIVNMPPLECYMNNVKDKRKWWQYRLNGIKPGDIIYATVTKTLAFGPHRILVKPLCTSEPNSRYLADVPIKAVVTEDNLGAQATTKRNNVRAFNTNDYLRCEVYDISVDAERMTLSISGELTKSPLPLGLVDLRDFPEFFRETMNLESKTYEEQLVQSSEFDNPNYEALYQMNGLNINDNFSLLNTLKLDFPREEYATELRIRQASTWAFHYVAEGIERFKNGQQVEAFQCLNKALNIDPRNVEGLVARGALYANKGSFLKAIEDFEKALKLNSYHVNARKYMGETLVALGHSFEEEQRIPEAVKAYTDCLNLIPNHEQARISLDALQRPSGVQLPVTDGFGNQTKKPNISSSESDTESDSPTSAETSHRRQKTNTEGNGGHGQGFSHPFYGMDADKKALSSAKNVNEFKLEDDETVNQVRKLLRAASKHKKSKKKSEKDRKKTKKSKKESDLDALDYMQKLDFDGAYRMMTGEINTSAGQLQENLQRYEKSITELRDRQEKESSTSISFGGDKFSDQQQARRSDGAASLNYDTSAGTSSHARDRSREQSTPRAPLPPTISEESNKLSFQIKRSVRVDKFGLVRAATPSDEQRNSSPSKPSNATGSNRLSFQIKNPAKMDKFGLMRVGTPLGDYPSPSSSQSQSRTQRSRELASTRRQYSSSRSRSRSRSRRRNNILTTTRRSRSWTPERFRGHNRNNYRRNRSPYHDRDSRSRSAERHRRFNSNNKNSSYYRRTSRERSPIQRRRTPSPFVPRGTPSPRSRFRRSRTPNSNERIRSRNRSRSPRRFHRGGYNNRQQRRGYANRVWQRRRSHDHYLSGADNSSNESNDDNRQWKEDSNQHTNKDRSKSKQKNNEGKANSNTSGLTIEEIDEIVNKAQKERKEEIIKRDKDILKKTPGSSD